MTGMRCLWCCLFVISRRRVKMIVFGTIMLGLCIHLYTVGIHKTQLHFIVGSAQVCGHHTATRAQLRLRTWRQACEQGDLRPVDADKIEDQFYSDKDRRFLFCSVPNIKDTFWKRVIRYVDNTSHSMHGSPLEIPKWQTFYVAPSQLDEMRDSTIRFLFSEDPYVRLWNMWVQKFFLMSHWFKADDVGAELSDAPQGDDVNCNPNVTFEDFLRMVTQQKYIDHPAKLDIHFRPQVHICDICRLQPTFAGKVETFEEDALCVLLMSKYSRILSVEKAYLSSQNMDGVQISWLRHRRTSLRSMRTLTMENFALWHTNSAARKCISLTDLTKRLWKAFQYLAFIPANAQVPPWLLAQREVQVKDFLKVCSNGLFMWSGSNTRTRQLKRQVAFRQQIVRAYESVPVHTLERLANLYTGDFDSLGYEKLPHDIYADLSPFQG